MSQLIIWGLWLLFALLVFYVVSIHKNTKIAERFTEIIRTIWYLAFILGTLIFITDDFKTLFEDWENYLIALVAFVIIDALLFLRLYINKIGNYELTSTKKQVGKTQEELDRVSRKVSKLQETLIWFDYSGYNIDDDSYILGLINLLHSYGKKEELDISLIPYNTDKEKERVLNSVGHAKLKLKTHLKKEQSYMAPNDELAFYPFAFVDQQFVVRVEALIPKEVITEVDGSIINTLVIVYDQVLYHDRSDENGESQS